jgi:site-specific recombinase XerD
LETAVQSFLTYLAGYRRYSEATITAYRRDLKRLGEFLAQSRLPQDPEHIDTRMVQAFAISLGHLAPASVNRTLNCLSSFFGFMQRQGRIDRNPVEGVERPKVPLKLPQGPALSQAQLLVEAAQTPREKAMLMLLGCCGLRRSELLNLDRGDLSSDLAELRVRQGKGQKDRVVPIPAQCLAVLREYLAAQEGRTGPLFTTSVGTRLGTTGFYRIFTRLLRRAGLEDAGITPHSLRHLYATALLRGRADIETVRSLLGHRDLRTTSRYLHADDEGRRNAVERLPLLSPPDALAATVLTAEVAAHE